MENASKALIIAGSILIAILLIAFGVHTFNSTRGASEGVETTMNATEISSFNNKFLKYVGTNKNRGQALALINEVISHNGTMKDVPSKQVSINGGTPQAALSAISAQTSPQTSFDISINPAVEPAANAGYNQYGLVKNITMPIN